MSGDFFAVGKVQWAKACELGMNTAVSFLVLARGSGRDNATTMWSADAIARHTGISWRRAKDAVALLQLNGLVNIRPGSKTSRPVRKLSLPDDLNEAYWLPNTLIDGVGGTPSPIARLRQTQSVEYMQAFIELYGVQDLAGDGGLPRNLIWESAVGQHVCDSGQFKVIGFSIGNSAFCNTNGPLARFRQSERPPDGWESWKFLSSLKRLGLLEVVYYLAESDSSDAELIHPLTGDEHAVAVADAATGAIAALPEWVARRSETSAFDYVLPVIRDIPTPAVVGVYRLAFRPHTKLTGAWWAQHVSACTRFTGIYGAISRGDYQLAISA